MTNLIRRPIVLAAASILLAAGTYAQDTKPGQIDFGQFSPPTSGGEFVEVNISDNLISMVARLAEKAEPDAAELLRGIKRVHVAVIGLDDENRAEIKSRVAGIRAQLDKNGWERIVTAQKKDEDIGVYIKLRGSEAVEGLAVTVVDGDKQAVFVNVVGNIQPEKVVALGEKLNIDPLKKVGEALRK